MKCPKVTLRSRPISHGRRSLYLDYYPAIRIPDTMKKTRTESLGIYVYARPRSQHEKSHNDEMYRKARLIASTRLPAIINKQYGFLDTARGNRDFLEYFRQIVGEHNSSLWKGCYNHFRFFVKNSCICAEVDIELCRKFRSYLLSAHQFRDPTRPLAHSSIVNYYLKFLSLLHNAYRDHMIEEDLAIQMEYIARKPTRREFLTPSELRTLSQTPCEIHVLKRASLFSCETGLRLSDVLALKWEDIVPNLEGNGYNMRIRTVKTDEEGLLPLSDTALQLCGPRSTGTVFKGFTRSMTDRPLKRWLEDAGITKRITFHCFRHTYAVLQLASGTNIYTLSKMMLHKSIRSTEIYLDLLEETKLETVGRISIYIDPEMFDE